MERRVVVTGLGASAPVRFEELLEGRAGISAPRDWEVPGASVRVGLVPYGSEAVRALPGGWRPDRLDPVSQLALLAAEAARVDSGITDFSIWAEAAVVVASAMGGERTHYTSSAHLAEHKLTGSRFRLSPFTAPKLMPNAPSANVAMHLSAMGPNVSPAAACASGAYAIAQAADMIRLGRASVAVAGAAEAPCEEIAARAFLAGEALSPTGQSLPFHRHRDGFVLAEGAAVLILEELGHARRRGARIYAELAGAGLSCDAYHVVAPRADGKFAALAITKALEEGGIPASQVGYVNAHATGTPVGDLAECRALREAFGAQVPLVGSTKGATGHLLGAAGALEAHFTILALERGVVPPTVGLDEETLDPACREGGLEFVLDAAREVPLRAAMSNSFAFGGHNAALLFTRFGG